MILLPKVLTFQQLNRVPFFTGAMVYAILARMHQLKPRVLRKGSAASTIEAADIER
jgi:hypothetical protein